MIRTFRSRALKRLYERDDPRGVRPDFVPKVRRVLTILDSATTPQALDLPGCRLHQLRGDRAGDWSVVVRANWRITFRFIDGDAFDVDLIDYH